MSFSSSVQVSCSEISTQLSRQQFGTELRTVIFTFTGFTTCKTLSTSWNRDANSPNWESRAAFSSRLPPLRQPAPCAWITQTRFMRVWTSSSGHHSSSCPTSWTYGLKNAQDIRQRNTFRHILPSFRLLSVWHCFYELNLRLHTL